MTSSKALMASLSTVLALAACSKREVQTPTKNIKNLGPAPQPLTSPTAEDEFAAMPVAKQEAQLVAEAPNAVINLMNISDNEGSLTDSYKGYLGQIFGARDLMTSMAVGEIQFAFHQEQIASSDPARILEERGVLNHNRNVLGLMIRPTGNDASDKAFVEESIKIASKYASIQKTLGMRFSAPQNDFRSHYPTDESDLAVINAALDRTIAFLESDSTLTLVKSIGAQSFNIGSSSSPHAAFFFEPTSNLSINLDRSNAAISDELLKISMDRNSKK